MIINAKEKPGLEAERYRPGIWDAFRGRLCDFDISDRMPSLATLVRQAQGTPIQVTYANPKINDKGPYDVEMATHWGYFIGLHEEEDFLLTYQTIAEHMTVQTPIACRKDPNNFFRREKELEKTKGFTRYQLSRAMLPSQVVAVRAYADDSLLYHDQELELQVRRFDEELKRRQ